MEVWKDIPYTEVLNGKREMAKGYSFRYAIGGDA